MSHFICEHCGAHIINSPKGYLSGCEHYPMEPRTPCFGCKWDSEEEACNHPLFDAMIEAGIIADCWEMDCDPT